MYIENKYVKKYISFWLLTMFSLIAIMIIVGGLTRLTDSGLSITTWELFAGFIPPLSHLDWINYFDLYKKIPEYKLIKKKGPAHSPLFPVSLDVLNFKKIKAEGYSIREAEKKAANLALNLINEKKNIKN